MELPPMFRSDSSSPSRKRPIPVLELRSRKGETILHAKGHFAICAAVSLKLVPVVLGALLLLYR